MAEEASIEAKLRKSTIRRGGLCYKFVSPGQEGVPDRLVIMPGGRVGFVEVKAPGKKPRPSQQIQIRRLRNRGFLVYVLDNPEQIETILDEIERGGADGV